MMWGRHKENGVWIARAGRTGERGRLRWRFLWWNRRDSIYIALGHLRIRLMKPRWFA